jgi:hypothetical protein
VPHVILAVFVPAVHHLAAAVPLSRQSLKAVRTRSRCENRPPLPPPPPPSSLQTPMLDTMAEVPVRVVVRFSSMYGSLLPVLSKVVKEYPGHDDYAQLLKAATGNGAGATTPESLKVVKSVLGMWGKGISINLEGGPLSIRGLEPGSLGELLELLALMPMLPTTHGAWVRPQVRVQIMNVLTRFLVAWEKLSQFGKSMIVDYNLLLTLIHRTSPPAASSSATVLRWRACWHARQACTCCRCQRETRRCGTSTRCR